jgi:poly(3-hydroxybutyrate) depolymerase
MRDYFPAKVRKLVMAGAPVDIAAQQSSLSALAEATPLIMFQSLVNLGDGLVIGRNIAKFWGNGTDANDIRESLQTPQPIGLREFTRLEAIFKNWNSWTIDVPGRYYLEVVDKLYKRNELASGSFIALAQKDRPLAPSASDVSSCWERRQCGRPRTIACSGAAGRNAAGICPPRGRAV